jgi:hypothetical protein
MASRDVCNFHKCSQCFDAHLAFPIQRHSVAPSGTTVAARGMALSPKTCVSNCVCPSPRR